MTEPSAHPSRTAPTYQAKPLPVRAVQWHGDNLPALAGLIPVEMRATLVVFTTGGEVDALRVRLDTSRDVHQPAKLVVWRGSWLVVDGFGRVSVETKVSFAKKYEPERRAGVAEGTDPDA